MYFFRGPLPFVILLGGNGGQGEIKMASASTPSAKQKFISDCRYRVIESSSLFSVFFIEVF